MSLRRRLALSPRAAPYVFVAPFVLLFAVFMVYPLVGSLLLSVQRTVGPREHVFVGFDNFRFLLSDMLFWRAAVNTVGYAIVFIGLQIPAALGLAMLLNSRRVKLRSAFRFAFFSTHLVGTVFVAVLFAQLLSPRAGLLNQGLSRLVGEPVEIFWLSRPELAMPSILLASLWLSIGHGMIYCLAALQAVDRELYDAALVDGAGRWQRLRHVTLPGIRHVLAFLAIVGTIGALQLFELPYVLFNQSAGPVNSGLTLVMHLFITGFQTGDLGYSAAIGWTLVLLVVGIAVLQVRLTRAAEDA